MLRDVFGIPVVARRGVTTWIWVDEITVARTTARSLPKRTAVPWQNPLPVMVTVVPGWPARGVVTQGVLTLVMLVGAIERVPSRVAPKPGIVALISIGMGVVAAGCTPVLKVRVTLVLAGLAGRVMLAGVISQVTSAGKPVQAIVATVPAGRPEAGNSVTAKLPGVQGAIAAATA